MSENINKQLPEYVMVHPQLEDDPVNRPGEIGVITAAIVNNDDFFVGFDDGKVGLYSADALLTFRNTDQIYADLKNDVMQLTPAIFKDLKNMALLLDYGNAQQQRRAMEIAQKNPGVISRAMISLEESLGLEQTLRRGR